MGVARCGATSAEHRSVVVVAVCESVGDSGPVQESKSFGRTNPHMLIIGVEVDNVPDMKYERDLELLVVLDDPVQLRFELIELLETSIEHRLGVREHRQGERFGQEEAADQDKQEEQFRRVMHGYRCERFGDACPQLGSIGMHVGHRE